jgi:hypothetical protein
MDLAFGGVLVTIFLAGFGYLATEIRGLRGTEIKGLGDEIKGLRETMNTGFAELRSDVKTLTDRYIAHLERHQ